MKKFPVIRLAINAMLAAAVFLLGAFVSVDLGNFKFTFENLPILVAAVFFGPVDGMLVGFVGIFLAQFLKYGLDLSTPLWILPYVLSGLFVGFICKRKGFRPTFAAFLIVFIANGVLVTLVNTACLYVYDIYYLKAETHATMVDLIGLLPAKIGTNVVKSVLYAAIFIPLTAVLPKVIKQTDSASRKG